MGQRLALIVATNEYEDEGLRSLNAPSHDAHELATALADESIGGFQVRVLADAPAQEIRVAVEDLFTDRDPDDMVLLHFSCHGLKNDAGKLFLAARDTRRRLPMATSIPADDVSALMLSTYAQRTVVLLDCCYGGAFERGIIARAGEDAQILDSFRDQEKIHSDRGRVVITASSALQYVFEGDRLVGAQQQKPSLFTGALVEGMRTGDADRDGDGLIGVSELFDYVRRRVVTLTPNQTPHMWIFGSQGNLVIARTNRQPAEPALLPEGLAAAATAPDRERRLWSIKDLREILLADDVPLALGAMNALQLLANDDSRRVAEEASEVLRLVRPTVDIDLVELSAQSNPGDRKTIATRWPAIVRATARVESEPWLSARTTDDGLEVQVPFPLAAAQEGTITVNTAAGSLSLPVRVTAPTPTPAPTKQGQIRLPPKVKKRKVENRKSAARYESLLRLFWGPFRPRRTALGFGRRVVAGLLICSSLLLLWSAVLPFGEYATTEADLSGSYLSVINSPWQLLVPAAVLAFWAGFGILKGRRTRRKLGSAIVAFVLSSVAYSNIPSAIGDSGGYGDGFDVLKWALLCQFVTLLAMLGGLKRKEPAAPSPEPLA